VQPLTQASGSMSASQDVNPIFSVTLAEYQDIFEEPK